MFSKNFFEWFHQKTSNFQNGHQDNFELLRILLNDISLENNRNKPSDYKEFNLNGNNKPKISKQWILFK